VVAKVEWRPGELYPRAGLIVTNLTGPAERVVAFCNHRGPSEQHIKEGKNAATWTRLSCHRFAVNAVRLQLHALGYNLANFLRVLALPSEAKHWSMTTLRDRLMTIGAKIFRRGRSIAIQIAEVMVTRALFQQVLDVITVPRSSPSLRC
jgi:Transposase DDE domain group 1